MTNRSLLSLSLSLFSTTTLLFACGGSETSLTNEEYDDVAQTVAGLALDDGGDLEAATDAASLITGHRPIPSGRFRSDVSRTFSGTRGQLDYTYGVECLDAQGAVVEPCDLTSRTASISVRIEGTLNTPRRQGSMLRVGSWNLAWDGADQVLVDGLTSTDVTSSFDALNRTDTRSYVLAADASYVGVELDRATGRFVAGRIEYAVDAQRTRTTDFRDVEASFTVDAVVDLTPNGPLLITLDRNRTYTVDRLTGAVSAPPAP